MLEDDVMAIMESASMAQLEGFSQEDIRTYLTELPSETDGFLTILYNTDQPLDEAEDRTLVIGAQLDNLLVGKDSWFPRFRQGNNSPNPEVCLDYSRRARAITNETKEILRAAPTWTYEGEPHSLSLMGIINHRGMISMDWQIKKQTPILLVPGKTFPKPEETIFSIRRKPHLKWERIDGEMYKQFSVGAKPLVEEIIAKTGLGYIS
ncbi:hypothetical protein HOF78_02850 [Candidatus Woesearchaeota archaeon]|jgi:hypothetical protein|nr:hypothetical protein [Candidatus Woesearchaeota archaeon]MBT6044658.1 hypothetical protein [Candidatus Woesearchaeota archaeon]